jgi:hypothetical protein
MWYPEGHVYTLSKMFNHCSVEAVLMRWFKSNLRKIGIIVTAGLLLAWVVWMSFSVLGIQAGRAPAINTGTVQETPTVDVTAVVQDQLRQQDEKLQRDNSLPWTILNTVGGPILLAFAAIVSTIIGFGQWRGNREEERRKRDEERFQDVVEGLGSEREEAKVGAAIMLRTFLRKGYEQFYRQAFDLAVAHLRLPRNSHPLEDPDGMPPSLEDANIPSPVTTLSKALIVVFKESFPLVRDQNKGSPQSLDATGIQLDSAFLSEADLKQVWMPRAFLQEADLSRANLSRANLIGTNLVGANLSGANLSEAKLNGASLNGADLRKADLRKADLRWADLRQAKLEGALLKDTILHRAANGLTEEHLETCKAKGAIIDESTLSSLQSTVFSPPSPQSNSVQVPSAAPAQESTQTPDAGGSSAVSSQQNLES